MTLKINEIFSTIQGEGSWTGRSATFIRFSKCNLSCVWCDTEFEEFVDMTIDEILDHVKSAPAINVVITGGEPTLQLEGLYDLTERLRNDGFFVALETNGTNRIEIEMFDHVTISPKENVEMAKENQNKNRPLNQFFCHNLKIVDIGQTYEELNAWSRRVKAYNGYYLQPLSNDEKSIKRCAEIVQNSSTWRLSLQTHKMIGLP